MKTRLLLAALTLAPLLCAAPIKVMLLTGQSNQWHNWTVSSPILKRHLDAAGLFETTVVTSPEKGADNASFAPNWADYQVVVMDYDGDEWPESTKAAFTAYVRNGGGFVSVHAANNSFPQWKEYNDMIGVGGWGGRNEKSGPWLYVKDGKLSRDSSAGNAGAHGPQHEFLVEIQNTEHPIMRGLPKRWMHAKDELYSKLRGPAENVEILSSSLSDLTNVQEPNNLVLKYHQGRVFHTTLGHADYSMLDRGFYTILQRGTEWVATGDVERTAAVPADFPSESAVSVVKLEGHPKQEAPAPKPSKKQK